MKYIQDLRKHFKNAVVFSKSDIKIFLKSKKISVKYLELMIHNLLAKHEIKRISRGIYTFRDEIQVVGFAFRPFYYGLQDALSLRNLWEQETNPVVITPRKVRKGLRTFEGRNYLVKTINRRMFFGFEMIKYGDFWIPVSDIEKTLIDFVYFREPLGEDVLGEIKKKIDKNRLKNYLKRSPRWVRERIYSQIL